jgi:hypothetical protein
MKPNEITKISDTVERLLREHAPYRESDQLLWARIIQDMYGGVKMLQAMSAYELLRKFTKGELPSYESVSRAARKAREQHPELRGSNYEARKENEINVQRELGYRV